MTSMTVLHTLHLSLSPPSGNSTHLDCVSGRRYSTTTNNNHNHNHDALDTPEGDRQNRRVGETVKAPELIWKYAPALTLICYTVAYVKGQGSYIYLIIALSSAALMYMRIFGEWRRSSSSVPFLWTSCRYVDCISFEEKENDQIRVLSQPTHIYLQVLCIVEKETEAAAAR